MFTILFCVAEAALTYQNRGLQNHERLTDAVNPIVAKSAQGRNQRGIQLLLQDQYCCLSRPPLALLERCRQEVEPLPHLLGAARRAICRQPGSCVLRRRRMDIREPQTKIHSFWQAVNGYDLNLNSSATSHLQRAGWRRLAPERHHQVPQNRAILHQRPGAGGRLRRLLRVCVSRACC